MKKEILSVFAILLVCFTVSAKSQILTFVHEGSGSGTLDGIGFQSLDFVITATGDTGDRLSIPGALWINHISASILIDGLGGFDFLTGTRTFVNNSNSTVGFSRADPGEGGADLFNGPIDAVFATWDMLGPIGPINGTGRLLQWQLDPVVDTTGGVLVFNNEGSIDTTFTATPEPATMILLGLGGLVLRKRR